MNIDDIIESAQLKGRIIALDAQVETLTAEVRCLEAVVRSHERVDSLIVANLKAENERLRKAGDAMVSHIRKGEEVLFECLDGDEVINDWNAAKEGKQS
mgnify:CR=1 FL=1